MHTMHACAVDIAVIPVGLQLSVVSQGKFGKPAKLGMRKRKGKKTPRNERNIDNNV